MISLADFPYDKMRTRLRREAKHLRLRVAPVSPATHPLVHIIGCQRSGTTLLTELLDQDRRIRVFGELGELFDDVSRHHRLRDTNFVRRRLGRSGAALNVVKPLVESHRCPELIDLQEGGVGIWMFRHYRDVAASNLRRFGMRNGVDNLRPIVEGGDDWRAAGLAADTRSVVSSLFDERMAPLDAAALFWYCRNTLWFEAELPSNDRVRMCQYEQLVAEPDLVLAALYRWVGLCAPPTSAAELVHARSVGNGPNEIGDEVRSLCDSMWERLVACDAERSLVVVP